MDLDINDTKFPDLFSRRIVEAFNLPEGGTTANAETLDWLASNGRENPSGAYKAAFYTACSAARNKYGNQAEVVTQARGLMDVFSRALSADEAHIVEPNSQYVDSLISIAKAAPDRRIPA